MATDLDLEETHVLIYLLERTTFEDDKAKRAAKRALAKLSAGVEHQRSRSTVFTSLLK